MQAQPTKKKNIWMQGAISPEIIATAIAKHQSQTTIGAHSIFLGQVRADDIHGQKVVAISYTHHEILADEALYQIREDIFAQYNLTCMHIYHSIGKVNAGEICLFVFTSAPHRADAIHACSAIVERIKKEVPIWGKEIFADENYQWKINH